MNYNVNITTAGSVNELNELLSSNKTFDLVFLSDHIYGIDNYDIKNTNDFKKAINKLSLVAGYKLEIVLVTLNDYQKENIEYLTLPISKTKLDDIEFSEDNEEYSEEPADSLDGTISEGFDNLLNAKIGGTPVSGIVSLAIGILLLIGSIIMFIGASDRVIDNVTSGEHNSIVAVMIIIGVLLVIIGAYKIFGFKQADKLASSIKNIDREEKAEKKEIEKPKEKIIPKSNIPLDKESYKIGEFDIGEFKENLKKPVSKLEGVTHTKQATLDDVPLPKERPEEEKGLSQEEIEEIEYEKASLDNESIDDIFSSVEEIDEIPIVSVDSKKNKKE